MFDRPERCGSGRPTLGAGNWNGCDEEPTIRDLGSGIQHWHFTRCDAPAEYYFLDGMGHQVPNRECPAVSVYCAQYDDFDFVDELTEFFNANPLDT